MEYTVIALKESLVRIREQLNEEGKKGWELVSIVHQPNAYKNPDFSGHLAYFKKP